jgi:membrane peptidoglycan carboxypeptidase
VTSISQRNGVGGVDQVAGYGPTCRRALAPEVASGVNAALSRVLTDGTAASVGPPGDRPAAGKTGTTDGPYDTWFVGYTAQRSTAVWVGDPGDGNAPRRELTDLTVDGRFHPVIYGATLAAPIWKQVMTGALQGLPVRELP